MVPVCRGAVAGHRDHHQSPRAGLAAQPGPERHPAPAEAAGQWLASEAPEGVNPHGLKPCTASLRRGRHRMPGWDWRLGEPRSAQPASLRGRDGEVSASKTGRSTPGRPSGRCRRQRRNGSPGHFRTPGWRWNRRTNDRIESRAAVRQRPLERAHPSQRTLKDRQRLSKSLVALLTESGEQAAVDQPPQRRSASRSLTANSRAAALRDAPRRQRIPACRTTSGAVSAMACRSGARRAARSGTMLATSP